MITAERLKAARTQCKLTQQQIADILKIDRSTYSYYELGTINPSIEALKTLSFVYNVSIEWLVGLDRDSSAWNSGESKIDRLKAVKETSMTDLSKDERKFLALLRAARAIDKDAVVFDALMSLVFDDDKENE